MNKHSLNIHAVILGFLGLLALLALACGSGSRATATPEPPKPVVSVVNSPPKVSLSNPRMNQQFPLGAEVPIVAAVVDKVGLSKVEVVVNNQIVSTDLSQTQGRPAPINCL